MINSTGVIVVTWLADRKRGELGQQQWQVAGSAPENYERYLVPSIFGPWARELVDSAALRSGDRVLDLACGTGIVARLAAERVPGGRVVGLDVNPGMIGVARTLAPEIEWQVGNALEISSPDGSFDVVYCQQGLQFFSDRHAATTQMRRVLVQGACLALACWSSIAESPGFGALLAALERHCPDGVSTMLAPFSLSDSEELSRLLREAGFKEVRVQLKSRTLDFPSISEFVRQYVSGSPLAGPFGQLDDHERKDLVDDVNIALAAHVGTGGLSFPISNQLVSALA
jgi:ubiquinone/menaquinone biosynthesis C-methylase UbiE